jgi:hypothetical protein
VTETGTENACLWLCTLLDTFRLYLSFTATLTYDPIYVTCFVIIIIIIIIQSALQPLGGFRPAQLSLSILSRKVLQSAIASGMSNPQLGGEPGI